MITIIMMIIIVIIMIKKTDICDVTGLPWGQKG